MLAAGSACRSGKRYSLWETPLLVTVGAFSLVL
jgi:hypothetical protein